jgi:hypothetical protein
MYSIAVHHLPPLPGPFLSLNQIHRLYGVALSTLRRKLKAGVLVRVDGKGVTEASVRKLYGAPPDHPAEGESAPPDREESEGGSMPGATGGALPPDVAAEIAALRAERDTLKDTLDHERADRLSERAGWQKTIAEMSTQLVAVKGADYARDMAAATLPRAGSVIEGESGGKSARPAKRKPPVVRKKATPANPTGLKGLLTWFRR